MTFYKMVVAYDGTHYAGWQRLSDKKSVQGRLEETLSRIFDEPIEIVGAGRTDAGVHAMGQVASFQTQRFMEPVELRASLNHYLPGDLRVLEVKRMPERFHARHQAVSKHYRYILQRNIVLPFERDYSILAPEGLDLDAMREAAVHLIGPHDFTTFSNVRIGKKSAVKQIEAITITEEDSQITLDFYGNGFLYHMVRKLVSTLLAVGMGELVANDLPKMILAKDRSLVPGLAPAKALFLVSVSYTNQD